MRFFLSREFLWILVAMAVGVFAFNYVEKLTLMQIRVIMGTTTMISILVMGIIVETIIDHR